MGILSLSEHEQDHSKLGVLPATCTSAESYGASPSASAATNTAAIQAALNVTGTVTLTTPGTYLINNTLVISSNTDFKLGASVTIQQAASTGKTMLVNAAYNLAAKTIAANNLTSSGTTVTAITETSHGLVVGDWVSILWAATPGYSGVYKVVTAADSTHFTYVADYAPSVSPSAVVATIAASPVSPLGKIEVRKADVNIRVTGPGVIDYNEANQGSGVNGTVGTLAIIFMHFYNCYFGSGLGLLNSRKYALAGGCYRDLTAENLIFDTLSDAIHFNGPCKATKIRNISGKSGDDGVVLMAHEDTNTYAYVAVSMGDVVDWSAENISITSTTANMAIYNLAGSTYRIARVKIKNVSGLSNSKGIAILGSSASGGQTTIVEDMEIDGLCCEAASTKYQLFIDRASIKTLRVRNFTHARAVLTDTTASILLNSNNTIDSFEVDGLTSAIGFAPGSGAAVIQIPNSTNTLSKMSVERVNVDYGSNSNAQTISVSVPLDMLNITDARQNGGAQLLAQASTAAIKEINLTGLYLKHSTYFAPIALNAAAKVNVNGLVYDGANGDAPIQFNGSGTKTYTYKAQGLVVNYGGSSFLTANTGTLTLHLQGYDISADVTAAGISKTAGNYCYNTNAAAGTLGHAGNVTCEYDSVTAGALWRRVTGITAGVPAFGTY